MGPAAYHPGTKQRYVFCGHKNRVTKSSEKRKARPTIGFVVGVVPTKGNEEFAQYLPKDL